MVENNEKNKEVYKEHLLGFVLIKTKYVKKKETGETHYIRSEPITAAIDCYQGIDGLYLANLRPDNDEVIGIIPAQSGSLAVYMEAEDGFVGDKLIGYEFPGVEHPDWNEMIQSIKSIT